MEGKACYWGSGPWWNSELLPTTSLWVLGFKAAKRTKRPSLYSRGSPPTVTSECFLASVGGWHPQKYRKGRASPGWSQPPWGDNQYTVPLNHMGVWSQGHDCPCLVSGTPTPPLPVCLGTSHGGGQSRGGPNGATSPSPGDSQGCPAAAWGPEAGGGELWRPHAWAPCSFCSWAPCPAPCAQVSVHGVCVQGEPHLPPPRPSW